MRGIVFGQVDYLILVLFLRSPRFMSNLSGDTGLCRMRDTHPNLHELQGILLNSHLAYCPLLVTRPSNKIVFDSTK